MIKSFKCRETQKIWYRKFSKKLPQNIQLRARRKLIAIDISASLTDLQIPPSNKLEALSGDRKGYYSIRVNDQWRICFFWKNGDAYDVEIVDYH
ncbi:MAG TPA: plasmid maintenance system killer family protein [Desulfobulbus sp.]|nr:plasmid maintenance system killer family protein [Desulfobulbus sp.]